jgi:hypothetical protein
MQITNNEFNTAKCWSNYKHHYTAKVLIGITLNGSISFLSDSYGGRASDIYIVKDSKFLNKLQPGDQIMADRGFKISDNTQQHFDNISLKNKFSSELLPSDPYRIEPLPLPYQGVHVTKKHVLHPFKAI